MDNMHIKDIDKEKMDKCIHILRKYYHSKTKTEFLKNQTKAELKKCSSSLTVSEILFLERRIKQYLDKLKLNKLDLQQEIFIFEECFIEKNKVFTSGHPIDNYKRENEYFLKIIDQLEILLNSQKQIKKSEYLIIYKDLIKILSHLDRLHQVLYVELAEKGFECPFSLLWSLDDYIRDELITANKLLFDNKIQEFISMQKTIIFDVKDLLINKENDNLFPLSSILLMEEDFRLIARADDNIGYSLINIDKSYQSKSRIIEFNNGIINVEDLTLIFKNLSMDLCYIDEYDIIRFYNDNNSFFLSKGNCVGKNIEDIHPIAVLSKMKEIKNRLKKREAKSLQVVLNLRGKSYLKTFNAIFDERDNYKGFVDTSKDITDIVGLDISNGTILPI